MRKKLYFEVKDEKYHYLIFSGYTPDEAINECYELHEEIKAKGLISESLDKSKLVAKLTEDPYKHFYKSRKLYKKRLRRWEREHQEEVTSTPFDYIKNPKKLYLGVAR